MKIANRVIGNILGKPKRDMKSKNMWTTPSGDDDEPDTCPECGRRMPWISAMGGYSDICPSCER